MRPFVHQALFQRGGALARLAVALGVHLQRRALGRQRHGVDLERRVDVHADLVEQVLGGDDVLRVDGVDAGEDVLVQADDAGAHHQAAVLPAARGLAHSLLELGQARLTASLAVELPSEATTRQKLLSLEAEFWGMEEPSGDFGQRYLMFVFD